METLLHRLDLSSMTEEQKKSFIEEMRIKQKKRIMFLAEHSVKEGRIVPVKNN